jgi:hypothetical protein
MEGTLFQLATRPKVTFHIWAFGSDVSQSGSRGGLLRLRERAEKSPKGPNNGLLLDPVSHTSPVVLVYLRKVFTMGELPLHQPDAEHTALHRQRTRKRQRISLALFALPLISLIYLRSFWGLLLGNSSTERLPIDAASILSRCVDLNASPGPPADFYSRTESNRFAPGTKPVLIQNATIWTGDDSGNEQFKGDIVLDGGIIEWVGEGGLDQVQKYYGQNIVAVDAGGAWVTPGSVSLSNASVKEL